ncbi:MAG: preprotein translocase subunit YajC [Bacteroidaceae bacterium]|nr:preprotein translocase subunit YajC [Bacteroidaceae bacterium]
MILLQQAASGNWAQMIFGNQWFFLIAMILIFYFLMIRPQRKRQKEIDNFRKGLQPGQEVVTSGGIYGKIKEINDNVVLLEVAHNVCIKVDKSTIFANPAASQQ